VRVICLGAGVQSTTLLLLANHGELPGGPVDYAIFADTGWEPAGVYRHLAWLEEVSAVPIIRASRGNLRANALDPAHRFASIPLFIVNQRGEQGRVRRQCRTSTRSRSSTGSSASCSASRRVLASRPERSPRSSASRWTRSSA
jgi:hypothetical protein